MSGGIEAAGDIATGALIGRSIEPAAGEGARDAAGPDGHTHESACLNCATPLIGPHCHQCGQAAHLHRSFAAFLHDVAHGVFHFEGKFFETLPMLALRPGALTRRYVHGERARFVSPLALFLFSIFLMFAVVSWIGGPVEPGRTREQATAGIAAERRQAVTAIKRIEAERAAALKAGVPAATIAALDQRLASARTGLTQIEKSEQVIATGDIAPLTSDLKVNTRWKALDKAVAKANANPSLLIYKLQSNGYKFSWVLIPISLPFVWLMFAWRRGHSLYDHAVFITYSLSFMTLLVVVGSVVAHLPFVASLADLAFFVPPVHMYFQLRGAYGLSRRSALWRTVALLVFATLASALFLLLLVMLGLMG